MSRAVALRAVKLLATCADHLHPRRRGVVVLLYHRVGGATGVEVDLPTALFERQMEALGASGRALAIDDALALLAHGSPRSPDPVVVTFDDGTADFADVALPIMARHGIPATLYLATDFVEQGRDFPNGGTPVSWAALRDTLNTRLVTVGSHTHTHALLDRLAPAAVAAELDRSVGLIEDRLGVHVRHFAYPKAVAGSPAAEAEVRSRFDSAAIGGGRPNPYGHTNPYRLARSAIQTADGMRWYFRKLEGGMALEDVARRLVNRRRYVGATS